MIEAAANIRGSLAISKSVLKADDAIPLLRRLVRDEGLRHLRAYAFASNRPIADVARDVVNRTLRLDGA